MMTLTRLALRNLRRNLRRTLITMSAISLGLTMMIASINIGNGMYQNMIRTGISTMAGHVVVQEKGYNDSRDADLVVTEADAVATTIQAALPEATVVQRAFFSGLLTSSRNAVAVQIIGIDPPQEAKVSEWHKKITEGAFLTQDDDRGVLLGVKLATKLDVGLGDKVVLMTSGADGDVSRLLRVSGLMRTGSSNLDGFGMMITLRAAQELRGTPGAAHQISAHISDPDNSTAAATQVRTALAESSRVDAGPAAARQTNTDLEVLDWKAALPQLWSGIQLDRNSNNGMMAVIGFIVALGVLNTVLMSVLERVREFGVMLALGVTPRQLAAVILLESLFLGVAGVGLGVALGMAASYPMIVNGIDFSAMMGDEVDFGGVSTSTIIHAVIDWHRLFVYSLTGILLTVAAAIYPALKAARLQPVEAMRHI